MKKSFIFICGILLGSIIATTTSAYAGQAIEEVKTTFGNFNIFINGQTKSFDQIVYKDTLYVPVKELSTNLGYNVTYEEKSNAVNVDTPSNVEKPVYILGKDGVLSTFDCPKPINQ